MAYISNNSFIDGIIHRQMRKSLLECFDKIYILDLHGNSKKKETAPDGSKDENVFDIMQGVSINIFVKKKSKSKKLADVYHYDLYGKRDFKYSFLDENNLKTIKWNKVNAEEPNYLFLYRDDKKNLTYQKGFHIDKLFSLMNAGLTTARDNLTISDYKNELEEIIIDFKEKNPQELKLKYKLPPDSRDWTVVGAKNDLIENKYKIENISYRPFDNKYICYTKKSKGFLSYPRFELMKHFLNVRNLGLISQKGLKGQIFITDKILDGNYMSGRTHLLPLYIYSDENSLTNEPVPNFNMDIIKDIEKSLNLNFGNWTLVQSLEKISGTEVPLPKEKAGGSEVLLPKEKIGGTEVPLPKKEFQALDLFDYIYAVLHSPSYREKYKEFLKIDFPRVPYPKPETFWQLVSLGGKLRSLHLLEDTSLDERIIDIKGEGELLIKNSLNKKDFSVEDEKVELRLNDEVSIVNIPLVAWEFYIGGYQPAQKWLKDRVGRVLSRADMKHYNRIINALCKTDLIMKKIDEVL
ncbi:type ISP restriction/modification enzyme [Aliarcobacter cryaerophilus]|uniref:type ISP restriction/modification enzyme n=1 Tax=Aliarcobacter cryaerophilus TaxID=28198 RepID=UPI001C63CBFD|nr:type ISP restriction/modification enzyme [Aliarcobacter cryaerophilus]